MSDLKFDEGTALNLANAALTAAKGGVSISATDGNAVYSYIFSVFALGAGLVPVVGPLLSSICGLLGAILFPVKTDPDAVWNSLRSKIESLIGEKMTDSQVKTLRQKVKGFADNMTAFTRVFNDYEKAAGDDKGKQGETLRTHHTAFLAVLRAGIPEFQIEDYAVASLPLFSQAANIHLTLLADGVRNGEVWGFSKDYISHNLQQEFDELTMSSSKRVRALRSRDEPSQLDALKECIAIGEAAGWDKALLDTWREALAILSKPITSTKRAATLTYPAYAKQYYQKGREQVKPYTAKYFDKGAKEALQFNALSDYDAQMIKSVLTYAEFWPYLAGKKMPDSAKLALDREIFSGPYGRYTKGAAWDAKNPPPIKPREANITAIKVRAWDDIDALQVQYGGQWGQLFGNAEGGEEALANLAFDEYIQSVDAHYGQKLGKLTFFSNKDKTYGVYGKGLNAENQTLVKHEGFGLTSVTVTNWEQHAPPGTEGIIFGFRPLLATRG
ncbi:Delta endotoxin [Beauveria brongniartii RCEF 3172]|uniref:Delta endotoxin n=1 Tax=Beauveria brongniartii RCEF 3172 TaxID=1081107 RepID=A0A162M1W5_9HYPO|nr:Delta endotoxin [Beauveria brongniartii RCEF 3172]